MKESFWWGTNVGDFLVYGIKVNSTWATIGACVFLALISFLFEWLRYLQTRQRQKELKIRAKQIQMLCSTESSALLAEQVRNLRNPLNINLCDRGLMFFAEASFWLELQILGYILMLSVMLYDGYFLLSVMIGGGVGYFTFGQKFMKINLQNCIIIRQAYCTQICGEIDEARNNGESTPAERPSTSANSCHSIEENERNQQVVSVNVHSECD